jgi:hypothetical protein
MVASRVVFIPKSDGTFRPWGIGDAWIRLFGRIISQKFAKRLVIQLNPVQLCVRISGGSEIAARLADIYLSRLDKLGNPGPMLSMKYAMESYMMACDQYVQNYLPYFECYTVGHRIY